MQTDLPPFANRLKERRSAYGISQNKLAVAAGMARSYISDIETGKVILTKDKEDMLLESLERYNPDAQLTMLFDYVRIRFPTTDVKYVVESILKLKFDFMIHADFGFYSYAEHYYMGDIFVLTSPDKEKGVLLELKGQGCRQFECFLLAQHRSWYDFFMDALLENGVFKRLDLAINDMAGILNIPELTEKCGKEECIYEKDYEQYVKYDIPIDETPIKNRFEIRLKNERAYYAVRDLLTFYDPERTAFSIVNRYLRFADKEMDKRRSDWKTNDCWLQFLGEGRESLKLTTAPEPYSFQRTLNWLSRQVAPTLKVAMKLDELHHTTLIDDMMKHAKLTDRLEKDGNWKIVE